MALRAAYKSLSVPAAAQCPERLHQHKCHRIIHEVIKVILSNTYLTLPHQGCGDGWAPCHRTLVRCVPCANAMLCVMR